ncbi:delta-lactam-biosynthetic de-N-acetylase [Paenibacillus chitinolyticus]|uniref:delta-lactam-biosynthetic de-N-acetylase n=1 Tax=Paenibacillus chitinolyticus TaxID=79263 RepID=UPI002DBC3249|nr:delta-lactam-biosynthetic de-N-acetylase [Paenibacillus chitinolyticus]MEC0245575.1 delta-lactam-biosynthetic de-N-acetylase [Paenibacillus chitinolyticus]
MKRITIVIALLTIFITVFPLDTLAADGGNKTYHFGFKKSKQGKPASIDEEGFKHILEKHEAVFLGDTGKKELYLTFDNGYENGCTPKILDVLKAKQVPAAFFLTGHFVEDKPELVKRMTAEGHLIGNHSWSHPDMSRISDEKIKTELDRVKDAVANLTGVQTMSFMRPPRGIFSDRVLEVSKRYGYTNVFWSVAYKDWDVKDQKGWKYAYDKVIAQLHPGAVILLHSISKDNTDALDKIIEEAKKQGYEFKSLENINKKTE